MSSAGKPVLLNPSTWQRQLPKTEGKGTESGAAKITAEQAAKGITDPRLYGGGLAEEQDIMRAAYRTWREQRGNTGTINEFIDQVRNSVGTNASAFEDIFSSILNDPQIRQSFQS